MSIVLSVGDEDGKSVRVLNPIVREWSVSVGTPWGGVRVDLGWVIGRLARVFGVGFRLSTTAFGFRHLGPLRMWREERWGKG